MGLLVAERTAAVPVPVSQRAVYVAMGDPPSDSGLLKAMLMLPSPATTLEISGADGGAGVVTTVVGV